MRLRLRRHHFRLAAGAVALVLAATAGASPAKRKPQRLLTSAEVELLRLQDLLPPALEANRKRFEGRLGPAHGFGAGAQYPQIWLRDSATLAPLVRWLEPREWLTSWLEEHLACQQADGSLYDWIAAGPPEAFREWAPQAREVYRSGAVVISGDKNTTEADQESSAVHAAYEAFRASGDVAWLYKPIAGETLIARLDRALRFVLTQRLDAKRGLVVNALTADWGDVSPTYGDQRAIYLDEHTPQAVSLYTNALFARAARELALLHSYAGDGNAAGFWWGQATAVRMAARELFWQPKRGFFRMHVLTTPDLAKGFPDDSDVFALGGNALAIETGIADDAQVTRILAVADARRKQYRLETIAGALLPPFPRRTFKHPAMAEPWQYQNGGQWDWFAGRLIAAAFERGHAEWARRELRAIAGRVTKSAGLYEWYTKDGVGKGSASYAGSAGALAGAVIEGLHGVGLTAGRLDLRVRLGDRDGAIDLCQPADGTCVGFEQRYERKRRRLTLDVHTNARLFGSLAVRLPPGLTVRLAQRGGKSSTYRIETVGEDRYAVLDPAGKGRFGVTLKAVPPGR